MEPPDPSTDTRLDETPILYQNDQADITLIDIPSSIAIAQWRQNPSDVLLSSQPPEDPFVITNEPKTAKAKAEAAKNTIDAELHLAYSAAVSKALTEIQHHILGPWHVSRQLAAQPPMHRDESSMDLDDPESTLEAQLKRWCKYEPEHKGEEHFQLNSLVDISMESSPEPSLKLGLHSSINLQLYCLSPDEYIKHSQGTHDPVPWTPTFHNPNRYPMYLVVEETSSEAATSSSCTHFQIPPRSSFYLIDCGKPAVFREELRRTAIAHELPRHFEFILLDPPWPNRSARRKAAYVPQWSLKDMERMVLNMDIDSYLKPNGLLGVWVTNKPAIRNWILGEGGLFERLNVGLIEEWIWVKTTVKGEPIFSMDSLWRKPYEILLLGRAGPSPWTTMRHVDEPKRRVIASVPDLHSRKPCLKELMHPFMQDPQNVLEIFARHLVEGWTSWGNEVLKFNWEGYWVSLGPT